jgi:hypothetical protein
VTVALHVLPVDDLVEHTTTEDCACAPRTDAARRDDGSYRWLAVHHSLDGREQIEPADG